jgi:hypothetical protein
VHGFAAAAVEFVNLSAAAESVGEDHRARCSAWAPAAVTRCCTRRSRGIVGYVLGSPADLIEHSKAIQPAARAAWPEYQRRAAYICQPSRAFRAGLKYFGFYAEGVIQPLILRIRQHHIAVLFTPAEAIARRVGGETEVADLIDHLLAEGSRTEGESYDVLLLTGPEDPRTVHLRAPITNDAVTESGKPWGWTLSQRYTSLDKLTSGVTHTSQL